MRQHPQFPVFVLEGAPYARGVSYGQQARDLISQSIRTYFSAWGAGDSTARTRLLARVEPIRARIGETFPHMLEELEGIAEGAGRHPDEIVALNARTELLFGVKIDDGCTALALTPEAAGGRTLLGQNWDWLPEAAGIGVILDIRPERGPRILSFVEAGMLARSGMNSAGLGLCGNYIQTDSDFKQAGLPVPVIRRAILEQTTLDAAIAVVQDAPRGFSSNHLIAHRSGDAANLEATPGKVHVVRPVNGRLVHTNHIQTQETGVEDLSLQRFPDSIAREARVRALLSDRRDLDTDDMQTVFKDKDGYPHSICRFASGVVNQGAIETVASVIFDLDRQSMQISRGPEIVDYQVVTFEVAGSHGEGR